MSPHTIDNNYLSYNYDPYSAEYIIAIPTIRDDDGTWNILNSRFSVVFANDTLGFYEDVGETVNVRYGSNEISNLGVIAKESEWVGIDQSFITTDWYVVIEFTDDDGNKEILDTRTRNWSLPELDPTLEFYLVVGPPDDNISININSSTFDENLDSNSVIAEITADYSSSSISSGPPQYSAILVEGDGGSDNDKFRIDSVKESIGLFYDTTHHLVLINPSDHETQDEYSIRLKTVDTNGIEAEKSFTLFVNDLNEVPTNLLVSASSFDESIGDSSAISTLSTADPDTGDTHTYSLVSGTGDTNNSAFTIDGDQLQINASPDYETQESYSIRLQTEDSGGLTFEKSFTLIVNDLDEGLPDLDGDGFVDGVSNYQMWTNSGGIDLTNKKGRKFSGDTSKMWDAIKAIQTDSGFSILLRGDRKKQGKYQIVSANEKGVGQDSSSWKTALQMFKGGNEDIFDTDFNGNGQIGFVAPSEISLSTFSLNENISSGSVVSNLSSTDLDPDDTHTYSLVSGIGDIDNSAFSIKGDKLKISASPDYETQSTYSIRLKTTDSSGGLSYEAPITLNVNDLDDGSGPSDADGDGFVDGITNYQVLTGAGGVDLVNRKGRTFSDKSSRKWDAVKAITTDSSIQVLIEGTGKKSGKFRMWFANSNSGKIFSQTKWQTETWMAKRGYEETFDYDINDNGVVGF